MDFQQITIVGVGLIGGSFALAARQAGFGGRIVGCDRAGVLTEATRLLIIDTGDEDPVRATHGSDLILLAAPVCEILDALTCAPLFPAQALITDVGSTKSAIVERARLVLGEAAAERFLPGHPMAGKELSGVEQADPNLFQGTVWLITPLAARVSSSPSSSSADAPARPPRAAEFLALVQRMGARVVEIDLERHDRLCAWISHLPQMLATALAATVDAEFGDDPELHSIGGRALREMTRIASSPYSMWRDIALTNAANISEALERLEQRLAHLRHNLTTPELEREFERAHRLKKR